MSLHSEISGQLLDISKEKMLYVALLIYALKMDFPVELRIKNAEYDVPKTKSVRKAHR